MTGSFRGGALRERREALGLSLADIYRGAHIPPRYIQAIEGGDFGALGSPAYALGFIKSYCLYLELEPEPFLDAYRCAAHLEPTPQRLPTTLRTVAQPHAQAGRPIWLSDMLAWGVVCALLAVGWLTYAAFTRPFTADAGNRVDAAPEEIKAPVLFQDDH